MDQSRVHTLAFATIDKELNHLMVTTNNARVAKNAAQVEFSQLSQVVPEDNPLVIDSAIFKHSGFKCKFSEEEDQQELYDYFHSHINATTAKKTAGYIGRNEMELAGPLINDFTATIVRLFTTSRTKYNDTIAQRKRENELTAWATGTLDAQETAEVTMVIDDVNLTSPQLQDLIDLKVEAKLKKIEAKIARLAKNSNKSATAASARQKKKNRNKNKTKTKKRNNDQQANDADNDSYDANKATQRHQRGRSQNRRRNIRFS